MRQAINAHEASRKAGRFEVLGTSKGSAHLHSLIATASCLLPVTFAIVLTATPVAAEKLGLIVPGKSVGPISAESSEADLAAELPPGQVKRVLFSIGEGAAGCGTEVFSGTSDAVVIAWATEDVDYESDNAEDWAACKNRRDLKSPVSVTIENAGGRWHTIDGIKVGLTISELARIIGEPVTASVCPCDFGGFVELPPGAFDNKLEAWAQTPLNADYIYADFINATADYMLSSEDIEPDAESGFIVSRLVVMIGN